MKQRALFLVRLSWSFRYDAANEYNNPDGWRNPGVALYERAFLSREDAERFCHDMPPIHANPFARGEEIFVFPETDEIILSQFASDDEEIIEDIELSLSFLRDWLREIVGVEPPPINPHPPAPEGTLSPQAWLWQEWWRTEIAPKTTDAQKAEIWRTLAPTPYEIVETKGDF